MHPNLTEISPLPQRALAKPPPPGSAARPLPSYAGHAHMHTHGHPCPQQSSGCPHPEILRGGLGPLHTLMASSHVLHPKGAVAGRLTPGQPSNGLPGQTKLTRARTGRFSHLCTLCA